MTTLSITIQAMVTLFRKLHFVVQSQKVIIYVAQLRLSFISMLRYDQIKVQFQVFPCSSKIPYPHLSNGNKVFKIQNTIQPTFNQDFYLICLCILYF